MHLRLSSISEATHDRLDMIPIPTNKDLWDCFDALHSPSRLASPAASTTREGYSPTETYFHFSTEIQLQTALNKCTGCTMDGLSADGEIPDPSHSLGPALSTFCSSIAPGSPSQPTSQHIDGAMCRTKFYLYELSTYWPAIYRIIISGSADPELLPYGPLFFQSVTSFLGSAHLALRLCLPKTWFLCAT